MKTNRIKVGVLLLSMMFMASCSTEEKKEEIVKEEAKRETVTQVINEQPEKMVVLPGELKPWEWVDMFAKVKGFVKKVNVDRGSVVKEGDVLAVLEAPELKADLAKKQAEVFEFKAKYSASKATYYRLLQTSKTQGAISENELDVAKSKMISDSSMVSSAKSALNAMQEVVKYLVISAPFNGVVTERNIHPGALVGEDDKVPMFKMENSDKLRLTVAVPEIYSTQLEKNCKVEFSVAGFPEQRFTALMARNAQVLNEEIRSVMIELDVQNKNHALEPGMYAELSIPVKRTSATMFVPATSVVSGTERVFVIKFDQNKAKWVDVKKGNVVDGKVEIFSEDIHPGDLVLAKASEEIRDGIKIIPGEEKESITMDNDNEQHEAKSE